jgi:soluble lytic murein transglycosylase-like protein
MRGKSLVLVMLAALTIPGAGEAIAYSALRDDNGVTHYTNAPTDPRYRRVPAAARSGTAAGWLRIPPDTASRYDDVVQEVALRYGLSPGLVRAVIRVESGFNPRAVSRKGAQGLMQLMPRTASSLGVRDTFDPRQNIEGGVRLLRYLMDRYPGSAALALAAYNAGEAAVDHYRGVPPYPETRNYVRRVLALEEGGPGVDRSRAIYRYVDADGTLVFSNVPPPSQLRLR